MRRIRIEVIVPLLHKDKQHTIIYAADASLLQPIIATKGFDHNKIRQTELIVFYFYNYLHTLPIITIASRMNQF